MASDPTEALSLLRQHPLLRLGGRMELLELARASSVRRFPAHNLVLTVGLPCEHVLLVAEGCIELHRRNTKAKTQMLQGLVAAPSLFGDVEMYAGFATWAVSARAVEPVSIVYMPRAAWDRFVAGQLNVAVALYREACARHMLAIQLVQIFALQRTENKILRLLKTHAEGEPPVAAVTQIELARALGLNPKTIARNLSTLEQEGMIRRRDDRIELLNVEERGTERLGTYGSGTSWRLPRKG